MTGCTAEITYLGKNEDLFLGGALEKEERCGKGRGADR